MGLFQENGHHKKPGQFLSRSCVTQVNRDMRHSNPLLPLNKQNMRNAFEQVKLAERTLETVVWQGNKNNIMLSRKYFDSFF